MITSSILVSQHIPCGARLLFDTNIFICHLREIKEIVSGISPPTKVGITYSVVLELEKKKSDFEREGKTEKFQSCCDALNYIKILEKKDLGIVGKKNDDAFQDKDPLWMFTKYICGDCSLVYITNDTALAWDLLGLNRLRSLSRKKGSVCVWGISEKGNFYSWNENFDQLIKDSEAPVIDYFKRLKTRKK